MEKAIRGRYSLPWLDGEYDGYHLTGPADRFNGYYIPYFSLEVMGDIVTALYHMARPEILDTEAGPTLLYPVGGQAFEWQKLK